MTSDLAADHLSFVFWTLTLRLCIRNLGSLIDDLGLLESEPLIEAAGPAVLSGDFEEDPLDPGGLKTGQRMPHQDRPQAMPPVGGRDADILNRADLVFPHALD